MTPARTVKRTPAKKARRLSPHGIEVRPGETIGEGGFVLIGPDQILKPRPPPKALVVPFLHCGSVAILGGYSSSLKTWIALDIALSVARGKKWLRRFLVPEAGRVTYISWEGESESMRRRVVGLARKYGVGTFHLCMRPHGKLTTPDFLSTLSELAAHNELIIVDSLSAAIEGIDENAASARAPLDRLHEIAANTGCTFLVIHHSGKTGSQKGHVDLRELLRGSSAIFSVADEVLLLQRRNEETVVSLAHTKCRNQREHPKFFLQLVDLPDGTGQRLDYVDEAANEERTKVRRRSELQAKIHTFVTENPNCRTSQVRNSVGGRSADVSQAIQEMISSGVLRNVGSRRASKLNIVAA